MKKLFLLILAGGIMMTACKKDVEKPQPKAFDPYDDRAVEARIKEFNQKLQQKSGEPMTIEDAVWCIEAALNYNYCRADMPISFAVEDSLKFSAQISNGKIDFIHITDIYNKVQDKLIALTKTDICLLVVDVSYKLSNDSVKLIFSYVLNQQKVENKNTYFTQAASLVANNINNNIAPLPNGGYYTNIETIEAGPLTHSGCINPNWNGIYVNYYSYLMFYNNEAYPLFHTYLSNQEIDFYTSGTSIFMNKYVSDGGPRPIGKSIISVRLEGRNYTSIPQMVHHQGYFKYGIPHIVPPSN